MNPDVQSVITMKYSYVKNRELREIPYA